jgi:glycosidase
MKKILFLTSLIVVYLSIYSCNSGEKNTTETNSYKEFVQYGSPFDKVPDPQDVTLYQVNIRVFSDEGNLRGVTERLDSIKGLGANVIYLMPIFPVGELKSINSPYCISDYMTVNSEFGTMNDLRELVKMAHDREMAVILDWVANHTSFDHKWINNNGWYMQDGDGNIINPPGHNWRDVAQLNFENAEMRLAMINAMKYWVLEANVDGYRCDYSDGPPFDFWKQALDTLRNITGHKLIMLAEGTKSDRFTAGFDYNFGFRFYSNLRRIYSNNRSVCTIDSLNVTEYRDASENQRVVRYTTNHDVNSSDGTPLTIFNGQKGSMAAFIVAAYMHGVPMIYNGQEVGTPHRLTFPFTSSKIDWTINPDITLEYKKVIAFRNESDAIRRGHLTSYSNDDVCAFTKEHSNEKVFVVVNMRDKNINYTFNSELGSSSWTNVMNGEAVRLSDEISLEPFSYLVLRK